MRQSHDLYTRDRFDSQVMYRLAKLVGVYVAVMGALTSILVEEQNSLQLSQDRLPGLHFCGPSKCPLLLPCPAPGLPDWAYGRDPVHGYYALHKQYS